MMWLKQGLPGTSIGNTQKVLIICIRMELSDENLKVLEVLVNLIHEYLS